LDCPKCKSEMEFADIGGIHVSRCLQCRGIWFKEDGHQKLRKLKGSQAIDIGDAEIGKSFDDAVDIPCPECGAIMQRVSDRSQAHIVLEACADGHGVFFDAGEYKDYKERTVGDLFKKLF
jgi:uncharacterized protein